MTTTSAKKNPARARSMSLSEAREHLLAEPAVCIKYERLLLGGLDSGESVEVTPAWWESKRRELVQRLSERPKRP